MSQSSDVTGLAEVVVGTVHEPMLILGFDLRVVAVNDACCRLLGVPRHEAVGRLFPECGSANWIVEELGRLIEDMLSASSSAEDLEIKIGSEVAGRRRVVISARRLDDDELILLAFERVSASRAEERALRRRSEHLEARVEELMREVYELNRKITRAEHLERRRISEILHEDIQQRIYGIGLHVGLARRDARAGNKEQVLKDLADVEKWLEESIEILRRLTVDLSPAGAKSESLAAVLAQLADQMNELHGLKVELHANRSLEMPSEMRVLLYQSVRELLFNVVKHSGARRAIVDVHRENDQVEIRVADEGSGFDPTRIGTPSEKDAGFGLVNLRERLGAFGGSMTIDSAPGRGTRITIRLPIQR